jgi:LPS-assembly lipoprotein
MGNRQDHEVFISPIKDREGQILRNDLQDFFHSGAKTAHTPYLLTVTLEVDKGELGFRRDETSRRTRITLRAVYNLIDRRTQKSLLSQTASVVTGYSVGSSASFASLPLIISEKDAVKRGLSQLSHDIHISVSSFLMSFQRPGLQASDRPNKSAQNVDICTTDSEKTQPKATPIAQPKATPKNGLFMSQRETELGISRGNF